MQATINNVNGLAAMTKNRTALTVSALQDKCPSVFAKHASHRMSESYSFVPSYTAVEALAKMGLVPVDASQRKSHEPASARHMIRFALAKSLTKAKQVGDFAEEVILVNSHNGRSAFKLYYGLFVFACANGLIVPEATVGMTRRHIGDVKTILDEVTKVLDQGPKVIGIVQAMKGLELKPAQRLTFAQKALALRYASEEKRPGVPAKLPSIVADQLLEARRTADKGNDLWHTFNVVQENLVMGGLVGKSTIGRATHTRQLHDVRKLVGVNTNLWSLAQDTLKVAA